MSSKTERNLLTYDGVTYRIEADALADLLSNGIVIPDPEEQGALRLSPDHGFDEVDEHAIPVSRRPDFDPRGLLLSMLSSHRDGQGGR